MSTRTVHTPFHAGDLISKRTARRARAHPRTVAVPDAAAAPAPATNAGLAARRDTPSPAGEAKILRRWSVAALIASAPRSRVVA
jgi:hypothetical protein